jgi:hypothetical protein
MTEIKRQTTIRILPEHQRAIGLAKIEGRYPGGLQQIVDIGIPMVLGLEAPPRMDAGILEGLTPEQIELVEIAAKVLRNPPQGPMAEDMMKALHSVLKSLDYMSGRRSKQAG